MENYLVLNRDNIEDSLYGYMLNYSSRRNNLATLNYFGRDVCFDECIRMIEKVAQYLLDLGCKKGDSVTVCLPNIPSAVYAVYGINRAGGVINIVHPLINPKRLSGAIRETYSEILFVTTEYYLKNKADIDGLSLKKIILCPIADDMPKLTAKLYKLKNNNGFAFNNKLSNVNAIAFSHAVATAGNHAYPVVTGIDTAVYMHSGGTTGVPKTVVLTNKNLNAMVLNLLSAIEEGDNGYVYSEADTMYGALPFFHGYGLGVCLHASMCARIRLALIPKFSADGFIRALTKQNITVTAGLPSMYQKILNNKKFSGDILKTLKNAYVGSEKTPEDIIQRFNETIANGGGTCVLEEGYGLSETVNVCLLNRKAKNRKGSVGAPIANTYAEVFGADNKPLEVGEVGELCISSQAVMDGYLKDSETTKNVLFEDENGKNWLRTGDLAHRDEDNFIFYDGRIKRLIVISGINVYPTEIEKTALELDFVSEACAVSAIKDGKRIIVLNVVLKGGAELSDEMKKQVLLRLKTNLSKWYLPTLIIARKELPKTQFDKVDYLALENKLQ